MNLLRRLYPELFKEPPAYPIVTCDACKNFRTDPVNAAGGAGSCLKKAMSASSAPSRYDALPAPCWPAAPRYCLAFEALTDARKA